jgi:hypothetical protein
MIIINEIHKKNKFKFVSKGAWNKEPDELHYIKDFFRCRIARNGGGALCGYIMIEKKEFKFYEKEYTEECFDTLDIHGGLTYSSFEEDGNYWLGFDTAHYNDYSPVYGMGNPFDYKDINFVKEEIDKLRDFLFPVKQRLLKKINSF